MLVPYDIDKIEADLAQRSIDNFQRYVDEGAHPFTAQFFTELDVRSLEDCDRIPVLTMRYRTMVRYAYRNCLAAEVEKISRGDDLARANIRWTLTHAKEAGLDCSEFEQ